jgi:hypothetical protein
MPSLAGWVRGNGHRSTVAGPQTIAVGAGDRLFSISTHAGGLSSRSEAVAEKKKQIEAAIKNKPGN